MTEFSAFLAGLVMGGSSSPQPSSDGSRLHVNIAMQDIAFCQALRNIIDGLEEYVKTEHPTPEQFIRKLLPPENFKKPYTEAEKNIIDNNEYTVERYVSWINEELKSSGEKWEGLTAMRMIWRDPTHTPDVDHLDYLFSTTWHASPAKNNGRMYEYDTYTPLAGLAKDFFNTIPASRIRAMCCKFSYDTVQGHGFMYDPSRFEHNAQKDKNNTTDQWKLQSRIEYYTMLAVEQPNNFSTPWSDYTRPLCAPIVACSSLDLLSSSDSTGETPLIGQVEQNSGYGERISVYEILSYQEKESFKRIYCAQQDRKARQKHKFHYTFDDIYPYPIIVGGALAIAGLLLLGSEIPVLGIFMAIIGSVMALGTYLFNIFYEGKDVVMKCLEKMQEEYYNKTNSPAAKEYAKLLERAQNAPPKSPYNPDHFR